MKQILKVYSKTVSVIEETAVDIYRNYVGDGRGFCWKATIKIMTVMFFLKESGSSDSDGKGQLTVQKRSGEVLRFSGNPAEALKAYADSFEIRRDGSLLPFSGGLVGALGYDFVRYQENLPDDNPDEIGIETIQLMLVTEFLSIDHVAETMTAVVLEEDSEEGGQRAAGRLAKMLKEAFAKADDGEKAGSKADRIRTDGLSGSPILWKNTVQR